MKKSKKIAAFLLFSMLLTGIFSVLNSANAATTQSWPTFMNNYQRTGASSNTGPRTNTTLWTWYSGYSMPYSDPRDALESVALTPAVENGIVYVGTDENRTVALDEFTGKVIWQFPIGGLGRTPPTIADGKVFIGSSSGTPTSTTAGREDGYLYALDAKNGNLIWKHGPIDLTEGLAEGIWTLSPIVTQGLVIFGAQQIYALNETNGNLVWNATKSEGLAHSFGIALSGNTIVASSLDFNVYAFDLVTGQKLWSYTTGNYIESVPTIYNGNVYVGSTDNYTYCLNLADGSLKWKTLMGYSNEWKFGGGGWNHDGAADGMIFAAGPDGNELALNATNGNIIWTFNRGNASWTGTNIAGGVAYLGNWNGKIFALDEFTGKELWTFQTNGTLNGDPAIVDGLLIWGSSHDGNLYAIGTPTNIPEYPYVIGVVVLVIVAATAIPLYLKRKRQ